MAPGVGNRNPAASSMRFPPGSPAHPPTDDTAQLRPGPFEDHRIVRGDDARFLLRLRQHARACDTGRVPYPPAEALGGRGRRAEAPRTRLPLRAVPQGAPPAVRPDAPVIRGQHMVQLRPLL